ncbi:MAG TPA: septal ring lytic transglycosylase RlpA family protein [Terracidiphilus sp.]|nr:septal ring lytic transglycosylase RlpA family protein [Terracidiphilus sp.]
MAGVSAVAMVALVVLFSARTVQADASLPKPAFTAPADPPAVSATPASLSSAPEHSASLADQEPQIPQNAPTPAAKSWKDRIQGIASWYGGVFNGRKTADGETYDMYAMTACHPSLPFGSIVRVVDLKNHRSVVVRITDRGDLVDEGRIIDLSYGAAKKLGMAKAGLAKVELQVLSLGKKQPEQPVANSQQPVANSRPDSGQ